VRGRYVVSRVVLIEGEEVTYDIACNNPAVGYRRLDEIEDDAAEAMLAKPYE
jgi:hypothetical protein